MHVDSSHVQNVLQLFRALVLFDLNLITTVRGKRGVGRVNGNGLILDMRKWSLADRHTDQGIRCGSCLVSVERLLC